MSILRVSIVLTSIALLSRALGLGRDLVITWAFGATAEADSFYIASSVSNGAYVVVTTALISAVIPFLAKNVNETTPNVHHADLSNLFNVTAILLMVMTGVGMVASGAIAGLLNPGANSDMMVITSEFIFFLMPTITLLGCAGILSGVLNFNKVFVPVALGPVVLNLSAIVGVLLLKESYGIGSAVIGTLVGAVLFLALQIPTLYKVDYRHYWRASLLDKKTGTFLLAALPIIAVAFLGYSHAFVDMILGSLLGEGIVTSINVASKLLQLPQGVIAMGITTASFPIISRMVQSNDQAGAANLVSRLSLVVTLMSIACCAMIMAQPDVIVALIFGNGTFSDEAVKNTARILSITALSLPAFSLNVILLRVLYAVGAGRFAFAAFAIALGVKVIAGFCLIGIGIDAVSISTLLAVGINAIVVMVYLNHKLAGAFSRIFLWGVLKSVIAGGLMLLSAVALRRALNSYLHPIDDIITFVIVMLTCVVVFAACALTFLKSEVLLLKRVK